MFIIQPLELKVKDYSSEELKTLAEIIGKAEKVKTLKDFYDFGEYLIENDLDDFKGVGEIVDNIIARNRFLNIGEHYPCHGDYCYIDLNELPPRFVSVHDLENWKVNIYYEHFDNCYGFDNVELSEELETAIGYSLIDLEREKNHNPKDDILE